MSVSKVTWKLKAKGTKIGRAESAYFEEASARRFATQLETESGVSEINLTHGLTMAEVT